MGTKLSDKDVMYYPANIYKTCSYLAYLRQVVGLLTNKPSMKRLGVKKNHLRLVL